MGLKSLIWLYLPNNHLLMYNFGLGRKRCTILFILVLFYSQGLAQIGKYPILNFTPDDYQAGIQNIDFAQNQDMHLYVANNLGILSYNGIEWQRYAMNTGKKQRSLAFDETNDRLYVGSQGDFGYFENDWNYVSLLDRIPAGDRDFDEVWDVFLHDDQVYFCTFQAIYVYSGESVAVIKREGGFNRAFSVHHQLFVQSPEGRVFKMNGLEMTYAFPQKQSGEIVSGIIPDNEGYLVFYNSGDIEFSTSLGVEEAHLDLAKALQGTYVNHVAELSDARLVITTQRAGLFLFNTQTGTFENLTTEDGLQTNACLTTFQDYSGNLWVGMQNGIALVDINSASRLISQEINLQGSGYEAFETEEGTYFTTSNGIYFLEKGGAESTFIIGTEGPAYGMQRINNRLYAGHHTGLFMLENGQAKRCASTDGLWEVKQLRANPAYAIGGTYSGIHLFRINGNDVLESVQKITGFSESSRFFEEDQQGRIWVGQFYKGLYKLTLSDDLAQVEVQKVSDALDLPVRRHLILSRIDDEIYIGTEEGVYKLDQVSDEIVKSDAFSEAVGNEWVYYLAQDEQKNVHIYTENTVGFFRQMSRNNYVYVPSSLFLLRHSFNNDLLNVSTNITIGVFINANEGFIRYDPARENKIELDKKPRISHVILTDADSALFAHSPFDAYPENIDPIRLVEGAKILQIKVASFDFNNMNRNLFRFYLKGFDDEYGAWSSLPVKEYNNISEGTYEFHTQTLNKAGEIVTSQPLTLIVSPPFYKSTAAIVVYILLFIGGILLLYRLQHRKFKVKEQMLEADREKELSQKQDELKRLKEEKVKGELRHVNNLLAASTMNLVVKNEFVENIKEEIKTIKEKGDVGQTRKALDHLIKEIDSTLKVQEDWKQFEYHFDRVHGDFLSRLTNEFTELTPGDHKLCAFLRLNMDSKEISNLMGISLRGVEVARYRLRKKLNLDSGQNLAKFILEY